ncbi:hypothetical protein, partial [Desulfovibrio legallii]|uniref:hypothetical protein n=1 Tax=Desulfovibrio legallii TaxID=571438 RepID=UPI0022DFEAE1
EPKAARSLRRQRHVSTLAAGAQDAVTKKGAGPGRARTAKGRLSAHHTALSLRICSRRVKPLEHLTLEMLAYGRQKPAFSHFVARIFKKILAEQLAHFIR